MSSLFFQIDVLHFQVPSPKDGAGVPFYILRCAFLGTLLRIFLLISPDFLYFFGMWHDLVRALLLGLLFAILVLALSAPLGLRSISRCVLDFVFRGQLGAPKVRGSFVFYHPASISGSRKSDRNVSFGKLLRICKDLLSLLQANAVQRCSWRVPLCSAFFYHTKRRS